MKFIIWILTFFIFLLPCNAKTIQGGVSYTVEQARTIGFQEIAQNIDMNDYKNFLFDKNNLENLSALKKGKKNYKNRKLTLFSDRTYGIKYKTIKNKSFYYQNNGQLDAIDIEQDGDYPKKSIMYDCNGELDSICLWISGSEQFVFDKDKKLTAHWIDENCYNEKGELIYTRTIK